MTITDPFFLINSARNDMAPVKKLMMNLIKKMHKKYYISDENLEKIQKILHELLASLYISSEISYEHLSTMYDNKSIYKKHTGWAMNNIYGNIFELIENVSTNSDNHLNLETYLISDFKKYTNSCSNINLWNITKMIPDIHTYSQILLHVFPFTFVSKLIQNFSDFIDDDAHSKISEFIKKLIFCRNFRNDYKFYFESYLSKYDKYMTSFIIVYINDEKMINDSEFSEFTSSLDNIHIKENKIKVLEILNKNNVHIKLREKLELMQHEIVNLAKDNFDFRYSFRIIPEFCLENAIRYIYN